MRGRKPKPTVLKLLAGNPGKRAINKNEPKPKAKLPKCPAYLSEKAREEWNRVIKDMGATGVITAADQTALANHCMAFAWLADAAEKIDKYGTVIVDKTKGTINVSPYFMVAERAMKQMRGSLADFGLNPSARSRLQAPPENQEADDMEEFLKSG